MPRTPSSVDHLRSTIDRLPTRTREAMLEGISQNEIIVGAYSDRSGGVCPMLAAHRCGGRTDFVSFARAWDRFAGVKRARKATQRELRMLSQQLEMSLLEEAGHQDLGAAIAEHQAVARDRRAREADATGSWDFLRARRERRDAERAVARVEAREHELV